MHFFGARMIGGRRHGSVLYALSKSSPRSLREQAHHTRFTTDPTTISALSVIVVRITAPRFIETLPYGALHARRCRRARALKSSSGYHSPRLICERATFFKFFRGCHCVLSTYICTEGTTDLTAPTAMSVIAVGSPSPSLPDKILSDLCCRGDLGGILSVWSCSHRPSV